MGERKTSVVKRKEYRKVDQIELTIKGSDSDKSGDEAEQKASERDALLGRKKGNLPRNGRNFSRLKPAVRRKKRGKSTTDTSLTMEEMEDEGYLYDYVMVFKVIEQEDKLSEYQKKHNVRNIVTRLNRGGLQTYLYYSKDKDEVYCKIRCPLDRLKREADRLDYKLKLDHDELRKAATDGESLKEHNIEPINIKDVKNLSPRSPYEYIYGKYDMDERLQKIYSRYGPKRIPFRSADRLKLIMDVIETKMSSKPPGCGIDLNKHLEEEAIIAFYPLHDMAEKKNAYDKMDSYMAVTKWATL